MNTKYKRDAESGAKSKNPRWYLERGRRARKRLSAVLEDLDEEIDEDLYHAVSDTIETCRNAALVYEAAEANLKLAHARAERLLRHSRAYALVEELDAAEAKLIEV